MRPVSSREILSPPDSVPPWATRRSFMTGGGVSSHENRLSELKPVTAPMQSIDSLPSAPTPQELDELHARPPGETVPGTAPSGASLESQAAQISSELTALASAPSPGGLSVAPPALVAGTGGGQGTSDWNSRAAGGPSHAGSSITPRTLTGTPEREQGQAPALLAPPGDAGVSSAASKSQGVTKQSFGEPAPSSYAATRDVPHAPSAAAVSRLIATESQWVGLAAAPGSRADATGSPNVVESFGAHRATASPPGLGQTSLSAVHPSSQLQSGRPGGGADHRMQRVIGATAPYDTAARNAMAAADAVERALFHRIDVAKDYLTAVRQAEKMRPETSVAAERQAAAYRVIELAKKIEQAREDSGLDAKRALRDLTAQHTAAQERLQALRAEEEEVLEGEHGLQQAWQALKNAEAMEMMAAGQLSRAEADYRLAALKLREALQEAGEAGGDALQRAIEAVAREARRLARARAKAQRRAAYGISATLEVRRLLRVSDRRVRDADRGARRDFADYHRVESELASGKISREQAREAHWLRDMRSRAATESFIAGLRYKIQQLTHLEAKAERGEKLTPAERAQMRAYKRRSKQTKTALAAARSRLARLRQWADERWADHMRDYAAREARLGESPTQEEISKWRANEVEKRRRRREEVTAEYKELAEKFRTEGSLSKEEMERLDELQKLLMTLDAEDRAEWCKNCEEVKCPHECPDECDCFPVPPPAPPDPDEDEDLSPEEKKKKEEEERKKAEEERRKGGKGTSTSKHAKPIQEDHGIGTPVLLPVEGEDEVPPDSRADDQDERGHDHAGVDSAEGATGQGLSPSGAQATNAVAASPSKDDETHTVVVQASVPPEQPTPPTPPPAPPAQPAGSLPPQRSKSTEVNSPPPLRVDEGSRSVEGGAARTPESVPVPAPPPKAATDTRTAPIVLMPDQARPPRVQVPPKDPCKTMVGPKAIDKRVAEIQTAIDEAGGDAANQGNVLYEKLAKKARDEALKIPYMYSDVPIEDITAELSRAVEAAIKLIDKVMDAPLDIAIKAILGLVASAFPGCYASVVAKLVELGTILTNLGDDAEAQIKSLLEKLPVAASIIKLIINLIKLAQRLNIVATLARKLRDLKKLLPGNKGPRVDASGSGGGSTPTGGPTGKGKPDDKRSPSKVPPKYRKLRQDYLDDLRDIGRQNEQWLRDGRSAKWRAHEAYRLRKEARLRARGRMDPEDVATLEARDMRKYGHPDGPTFEETLQRGRDEGYVGDDLYEAVVASSQRSDGSYRPPRTGD